MGGGPGGHVAVCVVVSSGGEQPVEQRYGGTLGLNVVYAFHRQGEIGVVRLGDVALFS